MNDASFHDGRPRRPGSVAASAPGDAVPAPATDTATAADTDDHDDDPDVPGDGLEQDPIRGLLFDAALRSLGRARRALAAEGAAVRARGLSELVRARRMLDELRTRARVQTLGEGGAGDTMRTLVSLYEFCSDRLAQAAGSRDPALITAVEDVLTELRDAFAD
jgi:flagellin-specific chaperone FliS